MQKLSCDCNHFHYGEEFEERNVERTSVNECIIYEKRGGKMNGKQKDLRTQKPRKKTVLGFSL
jgi:hypothetical protein